MLGSNLPPHLWVTGTPTCPNSHSALIPPHVLEGRERASCGALGRKRKNRREKEEKKKRVKGRQKAGPKIAFYSHGNHTNEKGEVSTEQSSGGEIRREGDKNERLRRKSEESKEIPSSA